MKRTVLITGASGGIGSCIAVYFAKKGYSIALQYYSNPDKSAAAAAAFPEGTAYLCVPCDITENDSVDSMIRLIHERLGTVSVLVNCAGVASEQKVFSLTTDSEYARIFETNIHGMMRVTRALYDDLRANCGSIVNLSSIWGVTGGACEVLYSASKAAVIGFTKSLAKEMAPCGVTVNCVAPGWIPTEMNAHLNKQDLQDFAQSTPLGRIGSVDDVAQAVCYLAEARYVTGQVLCCDGGYTV